MTPWDLLTGRDHVLVAFDGPIAELPSPGPMADRLRVLVAEGKLPWSVKRTDDPFAVLAYAVQIGPGTGRAVHAQLSLLETELVATARLTSGVEAALDLMAGAGTRVTVVSSLAAAAVRSFLVVHTLTDRVPRIAARTDPDPARLPPAPGLITAAVEERATCLFIGSTRRDLAAARAAGVETLRFRPGANSWLEGLG
ncbi:HAD family hydrolase [Amycolatopsis sp. NPDC088138]|uniref:HAD family hydrolase n=1 Tax=Amycolatopsis sp. NPDC088138 TaxID=3363938 RepID=UPI0037FBE457